MNSFSGKKQNKNSYTPSVEIRVPLSANEKFLRMLRYLLESLQMFGGSIAQNAKCVVSVSRDEIFRDLTKEFPWITDYNVEFTWVSEELFDQYKYDGTGFDRLILESDADIVILADADIFVTNDLDPIIKRVYESQKLYGFIAHQSPFNRRDLRSTSSLKWWERIFDKANLQLNHFKNIHTGWGFMSTDRRHRHCPYYYNYGFIISPRNYVEMMGETFLEDLKNVDSVVETPFKSQIANTLSFERHQIPCETLSVNYNFPLHINDLKMRKFNPDPNGENSVNDIKVFHYCGSSEISREDFRCNHTLERALDRKGLSESAQVFQNKLRIVRNKFKNVDSK